MKTIAVINEKGGVGKTTFAVNVAAILAGRGKRVLLVDADAQGHATTALGLDKFPGLYDYLVRAAPINDVTRVIPRDVHEGNGTLAVLGSNVETRNIANSISDAWALRTRFDESAHLFDVCIIDTSPTPSLLHGVIYLAAEFIVYPTLCEFLSFDGLAESIDRLSIIQNVKSVKVGGIIPFRYRSNTLEHAENLKALERRFEGLVWPPVPERIMIAESMTYNIPVHKHAPTSDAATFFYELADRTEDLINGK